MSAADLHTDDCDSGLPYQMCQCDIPPADSQTDALPDRLDTHAHTAMQDSTTPWGYYVTLAADLRAAAAELRRLRQWKAEATEVIESWELVYEALGDVGNLGQPRSEAVLAEVLKMKSDHAALTRLLDAVGEHRRRTESYILAQPTPEPIALADADLYAVAAAVEELEHQR